MNGRNRPPSLRRVSGASMIEVLIAILILSFGMLALGGMISYSVQIPKMSANRAVAISIANDMIERMRANIPAFDSASYDSTLTYDNTTDIPAAATGQCTYPNCSAGQLATMDLAVTKRNLRIQLPGGGYSIVRDSAGSGKIFILWNEASGATSFATQNSDNCPSAASIYTDPRPRCIMVPFKL